MDVCSTGFSADFTSSYNILARPKDASFVRRFSFFAARVPAVSFSNTYAPLASVPFSLVVFLEIVVERLAARTLEQLMKVHVCAKALRKARTVSLAQGPHARLAAHVANLTALVSTTMIETHPGRLSSHRRSPL